MRNLYQIYLISDSTGETLDRIFLALKAQFPNFEYETNHFSFTRTESQTLAILKQAKKDKKPIVFLTSNNTREISDALKRRCLHLYIPFPEAQLERQIVQARVPKISNQLNKQLVAFIQELREMDLKKVPAISETIDWARTLILLHSETLDTELVRQTLNVILKFQEDIETVSGELASVVGRAVKNQ